MFTSNVKYISKIFINRQRVERDKVRDISLYIELRVASAESEFKRYIRAGRTSEKIGGGRERVAQGRIVYKK